MMTMVLPHFSCVYDVSPPLWIVQSLKHIEPQAGQIAVISASVMDGWPWLAWLITSATVITTPCEVVTLEFLS